MKLPQSTMHVHCLKRLRSASHAILLLCALARASAADSSPAFEEKSISPEWVKSLTARGEPTVYKENDLRYIGMPVGGFCSGEVYLGGDGRLWRWDIFNKIVCSPQNGESYVHPPTSETPWNRGALVDQGFALRITRAGKTETRKLDRRGFEHVSFCGEYPIGAVHYRDEAFPVVASLEAFSPFVPLNVEDSSLPATILQFTLKNRGAETAEVELLGWLENRVCNDINTGAPGVRRNSVVRDPAALIVESTAAEPEKQQDRGAVVFEDFDKPTYVGWTVEGNAFGTGPLRRSSLPDYQGDVGGPGDHVVNSHATAPGTRDTKDDAKGSLTSKPFTISRRYVQFWIGGGNKPGHTAFNLLVEGKVVRTATGRDNNRMRLETFDVSDLEGKSAQIQIVDDASGPWGNIGVGRISFVDRFDATPLQKRPDFGTMCIALLEPKESDTAIASFAGEPSESGLERKDAPEKPFSQKLTGGLSRKVSLAPGASQTVKFLIGWNFPNVKIDGILTPQGRYYATRFDSAAAVARYIAKNFARLVGDTRLWHDVWYNDSTLPHWLLERALANVSTLATSTAYRFSDGRFYGWEGVGSCEGTCTHVWQYEQAMGRLFPELDILLRERAEFNPAIGFKPDGMIDYREEFHNGPAIDGQAGVILRAYRDYQMSADNAFLVRCWPAIRKATEWLINQPGGKEGVLTGPQHNTLDTEWYGPVSWLSGLYLASLRASEEMAKEMNDAEFASECREIFNKGSATIARDLFNGEYFIDLPDPKHLDAINSGSGCEIDQVMGQSWAFQVGLGRVFPEKQTRSALEALWHHNFLTDVGPYRERNKPGRWYAVAGEAGLLMCTFPHPDWSYANAKGKGPDWAAQYFNECQSGYEYEVAGHMIWEGMVEQGLAVERAIHDRYNAAKRNPWDEIECGEHYARAMASYGAFTAICGYQYNGPKGYLAFAPRLRPDDFEAAFTSASGWGTFGQKQKNGGFEAFVKVRWGNLRLKTLGLALLPSMKGKAIQATVNGKPINCAPVMSNGEYRVQFQNEILLQPNEMLTVEVQG